MFFRALIPLLLLALSASAADINQPSWSQTDSSNSASAPAGWPAGMAPNQVEPTGRAMMGATKRFYDHINATATSGGLANAQTLTYAVSPTSLVSGDVYRFKVGVGLTNTGPTTLKINSLSSVNIQTNGLALQGGELVAGKIVTVIYDGAAFQMEGSGTSQLSVGGNGGDIFNRVSDRLYVGSALSGQRGFNGGTCLTGDWASKVIPNSICIAGLASLTTPNIPYASGFASRTSDNPANYAFSVLALGVNDSASAVWPLETVYNETRAYTLTSHTLAEESDIINVTIPSVARVSPYQMIGGVPIIVNKWLTNGRPDTLTLNIGGTVTPGDIITFTFSGPSLSSSPRFVSTTTIAGDTASTIAARLSTNLNLDSFLTAAGMYSTPINNTVSIVGAPLPSVLTTTGNVAGAATELAIVAYGGNTSAAIGIHNNSNREQSTTVGANLSGIVIDCMGLAGSDCTDTGGFGEAIALSRKAAINFYTISNTPGTPSSRIYSSQKSGTFAGLSLNFADNETAAFETQTGDVAVKFTKTGVIAAKGASFSAPGAGLGELMWVAGTNAGTCKLVGLAGTSATPTTIVDNVGAGC